MNNADSDIPEDPQGFRIEPHGSGWRWVRLADETTAAGFRTRVAAVKAATSTAMLPEG